MPVGNARSRVAELSQSGIRPDAGQAGPRSPPWHSVSEPALWGALAQAPWGKLTVMDSDVERWHIGDRFYGVTAAGTPDSFDLELEDLGPGVGRGLVALASMADGARSISLTVYDDRTLPIEVVEQFIAEARRSL